MPNSGVIGSSANHYSGTPAQVKMKVRDCWHDYVRQYQSYTLTLDKWLKMSIITYVAIAVKDQVQDYPVMSKVTYVFDLPGLNLP